MGGRIPGTMTRVAIALGSNVGDRAAHLDYAVSRLRGHIDGLRVSRYYQTTPVDMPAGSDIFLNAAAVGETERSARALLDGLLAVELERGRERPFPNASRTLDLDLILFGDLVIDEPGLVVPHPRFRERSFVLGPLSEIASDWRDPVTGRTVGELAAAIRGR